MCEKLRSDTFVLLLVTAAMVFDESKTPHQFYEQYSMAYTKFVSNRLSKVRGEDLFEKLLTMTTDGDDGGQVVAIAHMAYGQVS